MEISNNNSYYPDSIRVQLPQTINNQSTIAPTSEESQFAHLKEKYSHLFTREGFKRKKNKFSVKIPDVGMDKFTNFKFDRPVVTDT